MQLQSRLALPAELQFNFDGVFRIGPGGFPAHIVRLYYPVVGNNGPGRGSFVRGDAVAQVIAFNNAGIPVWSRTLASSVLQLGLGPFVRILLNQQAVPASPPGFLAVRGFLRFRAAGRPLLLGPAAGKRSESVSQNLGVNGDGGACTMVPLAPVSQGGEVDGLPIMDVMNPCVPLPDDTVAVVDPTPDEEGDIDGSADPTDDEGEDYPDDDTSICTE
jgi:hypothetical protein